MSTTPEFFVDGVWVDDGQRMSFSRVSGGPEDGAVTVSYWRGEDMVGAVRIDAAGWASVLAHVSAARHDGETFAVARDFHAGRIVPGSGAPLTRSS